MNFDTDFHVSSTYNFDLIVTKNDCVKFVGYDNKERSYYDANKEIERIINNLVTNNPFGKRTLNFKVGYASDRISDRGFLSHLIDRLIFKYKTANINIVRGVSSLNYKA